MARVNDNEATYTVCMLHSLCILFEQLFHFIMYLCGQINALTRYIYGKRPSFELNKL